MALDMRSFGILRFGTFEVDLRAGELRKQGKRIRLQEQPFQVLTVLLQHPGQVVTREELRNQNWPPDTFVDFDNSLNTAINKLRSARRFGRQPSVYRNPAPARLPFPRLRHEPRSRSVSFCRCRLGARCEALEGCDAYSCSFSFGGGWRAFLALAAGPAANRQRHRRVGGFCYLDCRSGVRRNASRRPFRAI